MFFWGLFLFLRADVWVERNFEDFSDGAEYHLLSTGEEVRSALGSRIWTPSEGGIRIVGQDLDFDDNNYIDLFFPNSYRGIPSDYAYIYMHYHMFPVGHMFELDSLFVASGPQNGGCAMADFNGDGYVDVVIAVKQINFVTDTFSLLFWGGPLGFSPSDVVYLPTRSAEVPLVADLNGDGKLDILFTSSASDAHPYVFWGLDVGLFPDSFFVKDSLPLEGATQIGGIADFDFNGCLDPVLTTAGERLFILFYEGDSVIRIDTLPSLDAQGLAIFDVNGDGYLDICLAERGSDSSTLYLGATGGNVGQESRKFYVPGAMSVAVGDLDGNGLTDIFFGRGVSPHYIYYQVSSDVFVRDSVEGPNACSGAFVADFDGDGWLDLLLGEMQGPPTDSTWLLWGTPSGFDPDSSVKFYTHAAGRFFSLSPLGNLWDRGPEESYLSSLFDAGRPVILDSLRFWAELPGNCRVNVSIRTGMDPDSLSDWLQVSQGQLLEIDSARYIQYRVDFKLDYSIVSKLGFDSIHVYFRDYPHPGPDLWPDQVDTLLPDSSVFYILFVKNLGNYPDTFDIEFTTGSGWVAEILDSAGLNPLFDHNGNGLPDTGPLDPDSIFSFSVKVTAPPDLPSGSYGLTEVFVRSSIDTVARDSVTLTSVIGPWARFEVGPSGDMALVPGDSGSFLMYIVNSGGLSDTFDIYQRGIPEGFASALIDSSGLDPLGDHNENGIPDLPVERGDTAFFLLRIYAPEDALSGFEFTDTVTARSTVDQDVIAEAYVHVTILPVYGIYLEPDTEGTVKPGHEVYYFLRAFNTGNSSDVVEIQFSGGTEGWIYRALNYDFPSQLEDTDGDGNPDLGLLPPHFGPRHFIVSVVPPVETEFGYADTVYVRAFSGSDPSRIDSVRIITRVIPLELGLDVWPDTTVFLNPGATLYANLFLTWSGEFPDSIDAYMEILDTTGGWRIWLADSAGDTLTGGDAHGRYHLAFLSSGDTCEFGALIDAPDKAVMPSPPYTVPPLVVRIVALSRRWPETRDSLLLRAELWGSYSVHNYPNPFSDWTRFLYFAPVGGRVDLVIFDRTGKRVRELLRGERVGRGYHSVDWDCKNDRGDVVTPGVYLYVLKLSGDDGKTRKIVKKMILAR